MRNDLGVGIIAVVGLGPDSGDHDKTPANENSQDGGLGDHRDVQVLLFWQE